MKFFLNLTPMEKQPSGFSWTGENDDEAIADFLQSKIPDTRILLGNKDNGQRLVVLGSDDTRQLAVLSWR